MRIALVISHLDIKGGAQRQFLKFAEFLYKNDHDIELFPAFYDEKQTFIDILKPFRDKIHFIDESSLVLKKIFPEDNILNVLFKYIFNLRINSLRFLRLVNLIKKSGEFDVINFHDIQVETLARYFPNTNSIWMMNDLPLFFDLKERDSTRFSKIKILPIVIFFEKLRYKFFLKKINKIIVLDNRNAKLVNKYFGKKAEVVRSGLEIDKEFLIKNKKFNKKILSLLTTNIFFPHRRYEDVIEALNILVNKDNITNINYRIIGKTETDIPYYEKIISLINKYKLNKYVKILGSVSDQVLKSEYENADIYIFPNHNQTWGLSVFEAMSYGCACIVSNTSGAHEVLTNNKNALIFSGKNTKKLYLAIKELVDSEEKRKIISKNGYKFISKNISWNSYGKNMLKNF
jgi:glycosyltransferase involved in cell wall biosynthesis